MYFLRDARGAAATPGWERRADPRGLIPASHDWTPLLDAVETEDGLWVLAALPGAVPEEVEVHLREGSLEITGRMRVNGELSRGQVRMEEIPCGSFARRFPLPEGQGFELGIIKLSRGLLRVLLRKLRAGAPDR